MITRTTILCARALTIRCPTWKYPRSYSRISQSRIPIAAPRSFTSGAWRHYAGKTNADEILEEIQELYATAKDEVSPSLPPSQSLLQLPTMLTNAPKFEIASDETEKKTVYAADDRAAAKDELAKLKDAFEKATAESTGEVGKEVSRRVGGRIRELERAVEAMEERAMED